MAKKKNNAFVWGILIILIVIAWYFLREQPVPAPTDNLPTTGAQTGDLASIDFVLMMPNGSVVDTNNETLAQEFGLKNYVKGPFRFVVGQSSKLKGFDNAIIGMQPGETRTKVIEPSEPVLEYKLNRTRSVSRNQQFPRYSPIKLTRFKEHFNKDPVLNEVIVNPELPWPIKVINITDKHVVVEALAEEGKSYTLPGFEWKSLLLVIAGNDLLLRHNPVEGQIITSEFGPATVSLDVGRLNITYQVNTGEIITYRVPVEDGSPVSIPYTFQVIATDQDSFTIRRINHPPQESLVLTATLLDWESEVKKVGRDN